MRQKRYAEFIELTNEIESVSGKGGIHLMRGMEFLEKISELDDELLASDEMENKRQTFRKKWIIVAACMCLVAVAVLGITIKILQGKPYEVHLVNGDVVTFNKCSGTSKADVNYGEDTITRNLTDEEISGLIGYNIGQMSAYGIFNSKSGEFIHAEGSNDKLKINISQESWPVTDTVIEGRESKSVINGVNIMTGYFLTKKNSKGDRTAIFYAVFKIRDINYFIELSGDSDDADETAKELAETVYNIIQGKNV